VKYTHWDKGAADGPDETRGSAIHNLSVLKAVGLIGCFVESSEGRTLTELARATGMNVSTAYRMLRTLTLTGVLHRHSREDRYFPGPMLLALANATFGSAGFGAVMDVLRGLVAETGESASLGVRNGSCVGVLFSVPSARQDRFEHRPGSLVNLHCSAMGKALLSCCAAADLKRRVVDLGPLQPMTPHSVTDPEDLLRILEETQARGHAVAQDEHQIGVTSFAVAIPRADRQARVALGVQMPTARWKQAHQHQAIEALHRAAGLLAGLPVMERIPAE
jgi:IclR family acetate operon transcriptional repressor